MLQSLAYAGCIIPISSSVTKYQSNRWHALKMRLKNPDQVHAYPSLSPSLTLEGHSFSCVISCNCLPDHLITITFTFGRHDFQSPLHSTHLSVQHMVSLRNKICDLGIVRALLYHLSYRRAIFMVKTHSFAYKTASRCSGSCERFIGSPELISSACLKGIIFISINATEINPKVNWIGRS